MEHGLVAGIHPAGSGERLPGAGGDRLLARLATAGPTLERLVEVAGRHGVRPAFDLPGA
jgi:hypothetical protein